MLTGRQIREGRALLGLQRNEFAKKVRTVTTLTINRAEAVDDEPPITIAQATAIEGVFDRAGVEFTTDGPWLRKKEP